MAKLFFVSCFEPSGDAIGAEIIRALKKEFGTDTQFIGIAGPLMMQEGAESWVDFASLNIMGIADILRSAPRLLRMVCEVAAKIDALQPDALICIDAPDFHIRIVEKLQSPTFPCTQFVSPSVWAWRAKRAKRFAAAFDTIFCILPFEPECYAELPVEAKYVGHPSAYFAQSETITEQEFRAKFASQPVIALLPGSRVGELARLKADFVRIHVQINACAGDQPPVWVIPTLPHLADEITRWFPASVHIVTDPQWRYAIMRYSDAALCCMGTAELELSLRGCPHLALYRFGQVDYFLKRLLFTFNITHGSLSNILMQREVVPEFLQEAIDHEAMVEQLFQLCTESSLLHTQQKSDMRAIQQKLHHPEGNFSLLVARHIRHLLSA